MKIAKVLFIFVLLSGASVKSQITYDNYFESASMRVDYIQAGNHEKSDIYILQLKKEPFFAGTKEKLIDPFEYGQFVFYVHDSVSDRMLYSRGYSTLFREWQDTEEAKRVQRAFYESIVFPFPKQTIRLEITKRKKDQTFITILDEYINPEDYNVTKDNPKDQDIIRILQNGKPEHCVDIAFIAEGYKQDEKNKFEEDCNHYLDFLLSKEPFNQYRNHFNARAVFIPSTDSGTDIPGEDIWKQTVLSTSFYTFGMERYLTTQDVRNLRDIAACVPYDQIYVLVNTSKYGGGGIYNFYNLCTSDNEDSDFVFVHEFGHGFAGLADEYDYGFSDPSKIYDLSKEPHEPNITTLVDFNKKWAEMIKPGTPIPTPYDSLYFDKIGAFEGAGYVTRKVYRPTNNCIMRSRTSDDFCPVCRQAITDMIELYIKTE